MSFEGECNDEDEDVDVASKPHAYVAYMSGAKEMVPVPFIYQFPSTWRDKSKYSGKGWEEDYLYKVFWSNDDADTPAKLLKRLPEIPVFEIDQGGQAGYYRASVLCVAGEQ